MGHGEWTRSCVAVVIAIAAATAAAQQAHAQAPEIDVGLAGWLRGGDALLGPRLGVGYPLSSSLRLRASILGASSVPDLSLPSARQPLHTLFVAELTIGYRFVFEVDVDGTPFFLELFAGVHGGFDSAGPGGNGPFASSRPFFGWSAGILFGMARDERDDGPLSLAPLMSFGASL